MIGETLDGRYEILRKIGGGGMGVVYEARHKGTGRRVAVKLITGDYAKNPSVVARFHREARASGAIETQHIAQVLDTGVDPASSLPYMVMEYLAGEDLDHALRRVSALPPEVALRIAAQACVGLQKAHDARVIHRDIKPANLFLAKREDGELIVKLLDFGIAKIKIERAQQLEASGLTRTGNVLGSPLYMSPEQARGHKDIDHRSDIWSLGIVLYQMLCGRRPHDDIEALGELIIAICSDPPRPVQDFAPWVPAEVAAIVHGALLFDPALRYQSAAEMLDAIRALLPNGHALNERMLVGVSDAEKQVSAPRFEVRAQSGPHTVIRPNDPSVAAGDGLAPTVAGAPLADVLPPGASLPPPGASFPPPPDPAAATPGHAPSGFTPPAAVVSASGSATTGGAVANELPQEPAPAPRAAGGLVARTALALIASAAVAYGVMFAVTRSGDQGAPPEGAGAPRPSAVVSAAPPVSAATQPPAAPTPAPMRKVRLVVLPRGVTAEVDGAPAAVWDDIIEIVGPLGSKHQVRIRSGAREATGEVTITEEGPMPPKLELDAKPAGATSAKPAGATSAKPAGATPAPSPAGTARPR